MEYNFDWGDSYEEAVTARGKTSQWELKLKNHQWKAFSYFTALIIDLNILIKNECSVENFELSESSDVYKKGEISKIGKVKEMIGFMRHAVCHPEKKIRITKKSKDFKHT